MNCSIRCVKTVGRYLTWLATHAEKNGNHLFRVRRDTIAEKTGYGLRTIARALQILHFQDKIESKRTGRSCLYKVIAVNGRWHIREAKLAHRNNKVDVKSSVVVQVPRREMIYAN